MALTTEQLSLIETLFSKKQTYYRLAYSILGNEADALDAVSQMTLRIVEKIDSLRDHEAFFAWSRRILINVCHGFWRQNKSALPLQEALLSEADTGLPGEDAVNIRRMVKLLPEIHREVVYLRYFMDYDYKDISIILEIPEGTVKSRLNRAIENLRQQMGEETDE
jgi:RNA polymerase sigma-70 factor (ECF subfamily)